MWGFFLEIKMETVILAALNDLRPPQHLSRPQGYRKHLPN